MQGILDSVDRSACSSINTPNAFFNAGGSETGNLGVSWQPITTSILSGYLKSSMPGLSYEALGQSGGIDNTSQAWSHYMNGNGAPARLGPNTVNALVNSSGFQSRHNRIVSGQTTSLNGNFAVNLTGSVFHVGRTNVNYSINCASGNCNVTYDLFVNDDFWDVDFIDENTLGRIPFIRDWTGNTPDGMGPNLERFGGSPFPYIPTTRTFSFPNPGY